jgi:hypothetical protein
VFVDVVFASSMFVASEGLDALFCGSQEYRCKAIDVGYFHLEGNRGKEIIIDGSAACSVKMDVSNTAMK